MEQVRTKKNKISVRDSPFHISKDLFSITEEVNEKDNFCCKEEEEKKVAFLPSSSVIVRQQRISTIQHDQATSGRRRSRARTRPLCTAVAAKKEVNTYTDDSSGIDARIGQSMATALNISNDHQPKGNNDDDDDLFYRGLLSEKDTIILSQTRWIATTTRDTNDSDDASTAIIDVSSSNSKSNDETLSMDHPPVCPVRRYKQYKTQIQCNAIHYNPSIDAGNR